MRLLHIIATPRSHESNTMRVSNALLEELYLKFNDLSVKVLDLFKVDLPAVAGVNIESKYKLITGQQLDDRHIARLALCLAQYLAQMSLGDALGLARRQPQSGYACSRILTGQSL